MYFVNWQRQVSIEERNGQKVVVKRDKNSKAFHEYILLCTYATISILLAHPSRPPSPTVISTNEGQHMRDRLGRLGISTPKLISITNTELVEEYIEGGDLYRAILEGNIDLGSVYLAGKMTGRLHKAGYVFVDNKIQNYLVRGQAVFRTDLGFIKKGSSLFSRSMDIGSFLASIMDLESYEKVERAFYDGYRSETSCSFPYLSLIIRNILSVGFSSDGRTVLGNMLLDSSSLVEI